MTGRLVGGVAVLVAVLASAFAGTATAAVSTAPKETAEVIVQLRAGTDATAGRALVERLGGRVTRDLHIINGFGAKIPANRVRALKADPRVHAVQRNAAVRPTAVNFDPNKMSTAFNQSVFSQQLWTQTTGAGIGVAVVDTGIDGGLLDFRTSQTNAASRVIASVVTNPYAKSATDSYGHGTHVAGLIAGNSGYRPTKDPLFGDYAGTAPDANLISIKASDDDGNGSILDVIYGIQFAVDHKDTYNIKVLNLSFNSTVAESYKTDPIDAAAEAAWFAGIVVVAAAGNRGTAPDAVDYAPANDPYVITVGAVDDNGTKDAKDDVRATWSSTGITQDGFAKPDVLAPGAHIVSTLARNSDYAKLCPACVREGGAYFQAGGTSMAAPIVAGIAADLLRSRPAWTPDMVKGAIVSTQRGLPNGGTEVNALSANSAANDKLVSNQDLTPSTLLDPSTNSIDYTRASWSRASWSGAAEPMRASWSRASWSCDCSRTSNGSIDPARASWSRASWSTSWDK